jgi:hypothetical protein
LEKFSLPRSSNQAPGFIIASGSVGKYLANDQIYFGDNQGVFVSSDAGVGWKMIA